MAWMVPWYGGSNALESPLPPLVIPSAGPVPNIAGFGSTGMVSDLARETSVCRGQIYANSM